MKKNIEKILALSLVSSMTFANLSFAEQQDLIKKSETVYVTVEGNEIKFEKCKRFENRQRTKI